MSIPQTAVLALNQADNERPECLADFWTAYTWSFSDFSVLVSEIELDCSTLPLKQTGTSFTCKLDGYCILWPYLLIMCIIYIHQYYIYIYIIYIPILVTISIHWRTWLGFKYIWLVFTRRPGYQIRSKQQSRNNLD